MIAKLLLLLLISPHVAQLVLCFPFEVPHDFFPGETVNLLVNKIYSVRTLLSHDYYLLPFHQPDKIIHKQENIGEIIYGDRIQNSLYKIKTLEDIECRVIESNQFDYNYTKEDLAKFKKKIDEEYRVDWIIDNLHAATVHSGFSPNSGIPTKFYEPGYSIGFKYFYNGNFASDYSTYIFNHVSIKLLYNPTPNGGAHIVGFTVEPQSYQRRVDAWLQFADKTRCPSVVESATGELQLQSVSTDNDVEEILWTYSVTWELSDIVWPQRWGLYLFDIDDSLHWMSIFNSLVIVVLSGVLLARIMRHIFRTDMVEARPDGEIKGWKLVHEDVLHPPSHPMIFSVLVGSGVQMFGTAFVTLLLSLFGFFSPANRGGLLTTVIVLFEIMGLFGGYYSAHCYRMFGGTCWKRNAFFTTFGFHAVVYGIYFFLNPFLWAESSFALPFETFISLIFLWLGVSQPLVFLGSYIALDRMPPIDPVSTNQIPRQIPAQRWFRRTCLSILVSGVLLFAVIFVEFYFVLTSVWGRTFYNTFGFLFVTFVLLIIYCVEIPIIMCYYHLNAEDYHWQWRAFLTGGASGLSMLAYSVFFFYIKLRVVNVVGTMLYIGISIIMAICVFVLTGTVAYCACNCFVRKIYLPIKVDEKQQIEEDPR